MRSINNRNNDLYIEKGGKKLRCGYTTGSCAAAASKAALIMLLTGEDIHNVSIMTPKGVAYHAEIMDIQRCTESVSCAVVKDGGDDPDITDGALIYAEVKILPAPVQPQSGATTDSHPEFEIIIKGGEGVGTVIKPGLDQPVGEAAINSVPRKMIAENLREVLDKYCAAIPSVAEVTISVPAGKALAEKTFNPKLGIIGGISILGTTGIVEPMSDSAIVETIKAEISVRRAEGRSILVVAPGNYGLSFLTQKYQIDENLVVMSSNFVYDTVQIAVQAGFPEMLFVGHIGKLIKVAGGIRNTHSMYGDHRMEILADICSEYTYGEQCNDLKERLLNCVMTDEAVRIINEEGLGDLVFPEVARRIKEYMEEFGDHKVRVEVIVFSKLQTGAYTELAGSEGAAELVRYA